MHAESMSRMHKGIKTECLQDPFSLTVFPGETSGMRKPREAVVWQLGTVQSSSGQLHAHHSQLGWTKVVSNQGNMRAGLERNPLVYSAQGVGMGEILLNNDNIRMVQQVYAAFSEGDIEEVLRRLCSDVVWSEPENPFNPAAGSYRGHAGFLEWIRIGRESEEIQALEPTRFLVDQDGVAVVGHMRCRAKTTGRTYESDFVHLVTLRNGKISAFQEFFDTHAAGEAFRSE